jgi:hypothetical protein
LGQAEGEQTIEEIVDLLVELKKEKKEVPANEIHVVLLNHNLFVFDENSLVLLF